jgi:protein required for attachment to host cells
MLKTWVVVADRARARIFSASTPKGPLTELEDLVLPEARSHERDLTSDRPGRAFDSGGTGRHAMEAPTSAKQQAALSFARTIAERVESGRQSGNCQQLVLVAPPDFLGHLKKQLGTQCAKLLTRQISKNLTQLDVAEIRSHLPKFL